MKSGNTCPVLDREAVQPELPLNAPPLEKMEGLAEGQERKCAGCGLVKPINDFYARQRQLCKKCLIIKVARWKQEKRLNPEWLKKTLEQSRKYGAVYRSLRKNNQPSHAVKQRWRAKNIAKVKAQRLAGYAVERGKLIKPESCEGCGIQTQQLEKHHEDYSKPLDVAWLCFSCHGKTRHLI